MIKLAYNNSLASKNILISIYAKTATVYNLYRWNIKYKFACGDIKRIYVTN